MLLFPGRFPMLLLPLRLPVVFVPVCPGALFVPRIPAALFVCALFPIGVRELLAVPGPPMRFVLPVPGRFIMLPVLLRAGIVECCCIGCDGRLGAELCTGALACGAGALGRGGAGEFLCWAAANVETPSTNAGTSKRRTLQETAG